MSRLWDKGSALDERILRYTAGEDHQLDERLVVYDVRASIAHAEMLGAQGLLSPGDCAEVVAGLQRLGAAHARGEWTIGLEDEDVHTALERRLVHAIGSAGKRIHLGRSRNDQVLTALRLYLLDAADALAAAADGVASALDKLAQREGDIALPGYTHMQQAMPSSVALWAGGFAAELRDDAEGLRACKRRAGWNPLGSAAGYGTPGVTLDRAATTAALGFAAVQDPVTAAQLSRGKAEAELTLGLHLLVTDLGRLAADLLLYYTQEFAYVALPESMTTGSSIMPQKRNPDVLELMRAAGATTQACLVEILAVTAKLGSGYQRDLQRIKAPLFRGIDLADDTCSIAAHLVNELHFRPENIRPDPSIYAAEEANRLVVEEGMTFRDAYRAIAKKLAQE